MGDDIDLFTDMRGSALDSPKYSYGIADYILRYRDHLAITFPKFGEQPIIIVPINNPNHTHRGGVSL